MKSKHLFLGILVTIVLTACAATIPGKVVLGTGQSSGDASQSVRLTFIEILEDSRCPADAVCIWAGQVKVLIEVGYGTESQQYTLTLGQLFDGDVDSIRVGEYMITLVQVDPYPLASQPTDHSDYQVTLEVR